MATDFALIRIVKVRPATTTQPASIVVKQLSTSSKGDLTVLNTANGTDVTIALAKKLVDDTGPKYSFNPDAPICIEPPGSTQPCKAGDPLPQGFAISNVSTDGLTLSVPALPTGTVSYKYSLFLTQTKADGTTTPVTIDPRITNGGQPFQPSLAQASDAGLSALTLVLLAILLLAAGTVFGWVLAGGRKGY